jgi:hypothetical protein
MSEQSKKERSKQSKEEIRIDPRYENMSVEEILISQGCKIRDAEPGTIRVRIPLNDPEPLDEDLK